MRRHILYLLAVVSLFVCVTTAWADVQECWQDRQDRGGDNWLDQAYDLAMTIDEEGNIYVTHPYWNGQDSDIVTRRYLPDGTLDWEETYDGTPSGEDPDDAHPGDVPHGIAVQGGYVCVTGQRLVGHQNDYVTICYCPETGSTHWVKTYDYDGEDDEAFAVGICGSYAYVTGEGWEDRLLFDDDDVVTLKYRLSDGHLMWVRSYNSGILNGNDYASSIAFDNNCNVYLAGGTWRGVTLGFDWLVMSYSPGGSQRWVSFYDGPAHAELCYDYAWDMLVCGGYVYATGQICGGLLTRHLDYCTVKFDCDYGYVIADDWYNGPADGNDRALGIAADSSCNIYVTGESWDGSNYDLVTIKYNSGLGQAALNRFHSHSTGRDIVVDDCDYPYATGWRIYSGPAHNLSNYLTIKYDPSDLSREWVETQDNGGEDEAWAIVAYGCETVYVTGESEDGAGGELEIATKKYSERGVCFNCSTGDCIDNVAEEDCQEPWQCWIQCGVCSTTRGDVNCDGVVNAFDIDPFVLALVDPSGCEPPDCCLMMADCNCNGVVDAFDIDPFVELLVGP